MNILVTGNKSGLGKYLFESIGTAGWDKDISLEEKKRLQKDGVDVIIHCAFNSSPEVNSSELTSYLQDTIFLIKELVEIPHKKFIFISSVDVYPKNGQVHEEDEVINLSQVSGIYGVSKLFCEASVRTSSNFLILRPTALLGFSSRKNSLKKIIEDESPALTLTSNSQMNYVLYENVLGFINIAIKKDLQGIYNLASSANISLSEVAKMFHKDVIFGKYQYDVGSIDNSKAGLLLPAFKKTSKEIIKKFYDK